MPKIYQNLDFNQLKTVYNVLKLGIFPIFDDIFTANILETWKKRGGGGGFNPHAGVLLHSEPVSQLHL